MSVSPNSVVELSKVITALKIGANFDWKGAVAAFEGEDVQSKVLDGLIAADDVAQIVGIFFPPAAVVANDLGIVVAVEPLVYDALSWVAQQPFPKQVIGQVTVWGQTTVTNVTKTLSGFWSTIWSKIS